MKTIAVKLFDLRNYTFFKFEIEEVFVGMRVAHHKQICNLKAENFKNLLKDRCCLVQLEGEDKKGNLKSHFRFVLNKVEQYDVKILFKKSL